MRLIKPLLPYLLILIALTACQEPQTGAVQPGGDALNKFQYQFYDAFDTIITLTAYCESSEEFSAHAKAAEDEFKRLHRIFDRFNSYEGVVNLKTLNDNAGKGSVAVDKELIDCLKLSLDWYEKSGGKVNVAMGSVTDIYQRYMHEYSRLPPNLTAIPSRQELEEAAKHTDIANILLDEQKGTVTITDPQLAIDLGSTAKGFATELVARLLEERGLKSYIISAGGNVRAGDRPEDGLRDYWGIGLENPDPDLIASDIGHLDVLYANNISVVSSGDYQRYYFYGDSRVHHLIDPDTLAPGSLYRSVIVASPNSSDCDALSTAAFLLGMDDGRALAKSMGAELLWVTPDGQVTVTDGLVPHLMQRGGAENIRGIITD